MLQYQQAYQACAQMIQKLADHLQFPSSAPSRTGNYENPPPPRFRTMLSARWNALEAALQQTQQQLSHGG